MSKMGTLVFGAVIGGAAVFTGLNYHFVNTDEGYVVIKKSQAGFEDTIVDVREFGVDDWYEHRQLAEDVMRAGRSDIMRDSAYETFEEGVSNLFGRERRE